MPRWDVQLATRTEDVGADSMTIHESGALIFKETISGPITLVYAPGRWLTVTRTEEDD